jgi:hypothetical protein
LAVLQPVAAVPAVCDAASVLENGVAVDDSATAVEACRLIGGHLAKTVHDFRGSGCSVIDGRVNLRLG